MMDRLYYMAKVKGFHRGVVKVPNQLMLDYRKGDCLGGPGLISEPQHRHHLIRLRRAWARGPAQQMPLLPPEFCQHAA